MYLRTSCRFSSSRSQALLVCRGLMSSLDQVQETAGQGGHGLHVGTEVLAWGHSGQDHG